MPEDQDQIRRSPDRADQLRRGDRGFRDHEAGDAGGGADHSNSISPLISCENPIPASVTVAWAGNFSFPLSLPSARAWRTAFSISRWAVTPSVLRNLRMLVLKTSSFMIASFATGASDSAFEPPSLPLNCANNSSIAST